MFNAVLTVTFYFEMKFELTDAIAVLQSNCHYYSPYSSNKPLQIEFLKVFCNRIFNTSNDQARYIIVTELYDKYKNYLNSQTLATKTWLMLQEVTLYMTALMELIEKPSLLAKRLQEDYTELNNKLAKDGHSTLDADEIRELIHETTLVIICCTDNHNRTTHDQNIDKEYKYQVYRCI